MRARSALLIKPLVSVFLIKTLYINIFNLQSYMISIQKQSQNAEWPQTGRLVILLFRTLQVMKVISE